MWGDAGVKAEDGDGMKAADGHCDGRSSLFVPQPPYGLGGLVEEVEEVPQG